jgi:hypothetical protein
MLQIKMGISQGNEIYFGSTKENTIDLESVSEAAWEYSRGICSEDTPADLVSFLITASWCGKRLTRYPNAKDCKQVLDDLKEKFASFFEKYGKETICECIDVIPEYEGKILSIELQKLLDDEKSRIIHSPLFKQFITSYPQIDPEEFEIFYQNHRQNFVEAGIASLRRKFKEVPPPELSDRTDWAQSNHQYLPAFLKKWQEDLRKIETRMRIAQKAWKESIS